jgi:hypothetical protein
VYWEPVQAQPDSTVGLFKIVDNGKAAVRVAVRLGRCSVAPWKSWKDSGWRAGGDARHVAMGRLRACGCSDKPSDISKRLWPIPAV